MLPFPLLLFISRLVALRFVHETALLKIDDPLTKNVAPLAEAIPCVNTRLVVTVPPDCLFKVFVDELQSQKY
jgi:hypothetical protein